jgi:hypothetical protein
MSAPWGPICSISSRSLRCTPSTYSSSVAETSNGLQRGVHSKSVVALSSDLNPSLVKRKAGPVNAARILVRLESGIAGTSSRGNIKQRWHSRARALICPSEKYLANFFFFLAVFKSECGSRPADLLDSKSVLMLFGLCLLCLSPELVLHVTNEF